jgi:hypothetical protein
MSVKRKAMILGFWSAIVVAVSMLGFMFALLLTFMPNLNPWNGIETYANNFKPIHILGTVLPSLLLASAYICFTVCIHYFAESDKKIWSHLSIVFGLMYAVISTANYFIQIITVIPSIESKNLNGLEVFAAGYPNSIFYALMASYFFMCISTLFVGLVFDNKKGRREIKWLFIIAILVIPVCVFSMLLGLSVLMPFAGLVWFVCLISGFMKTALYFHKLLKINIDL